MEVGRADSCGRRPSRAASTARRSSSKKAGSFIAAEVGWGMRVGPRSSFALFSRRFFGLEGLGGEVSIGPLQQNFDATFGFVEPALALAGERHPFLAQVHGLEERGLRALDA